MRALEWTLPARQDLRNIEEWLSEEAAAEIALRILRTIGSRAEFLLQYPQGGPSIAGRDFRALRVLGTSYVLIYRVLRDRIQILRVRHGRKDWRAGE